MRLVRADFHNHLKTGGFPPRNIDVNRVIDTARARLGEGGILGVINYPPATRYEDLASSRGYDRQDLGNAVYFPDQSITVIKGVEFEVKLPDGRYVDLLVLGLDKDKSPTSRRNLKDAIREVRDLGALIGVDHPFHKDGAGPFLERNPEYLWGFDFFETHNGEASLWLPGHSNSNQRAQNFFDKVRRTYEELETRLGKLVSSDGHSIREIGSSWMEIPALNLANRDTIVASLKQGMVDAASLNLLDQREAPYTGAFKHISEWVYVKTARKFKFLPLARA